MRTVTIVALAMAALVGHCQAGVYRSGYGGGSGGSSGSADDYSSWVRWDSHHGDNGGHPAHWDTGHHGHWDHEHRSDGGWHHDKQHKSNEEQDYSDWKWHSGEDWQDDEETTTEPAEATTETASEPSTTTTAAPPGILETDDQLIQTDNADVSVIDQVETTTTTEEPHDYDTTDKYDESPLGQDPRSDEGDAGGNSWSSLNHALQAQPSPANGIFLASNLPGDLPLDSILSLPSRAYADTTEPAEPDTTTSTAPREPAPIFENPQLLNVLL